MNLILCRAAALLTLPATLLVVGFATITASAADSASLPAPDRIREIAAWLPARPAGLGEPITNRAAWKQALAAHPEFRKTLRSAAQLAAKPIPPWPGDLFLQYSQNGNRENWQKAENPRRERIHVFALAECLENRGRYLAPLEAAITAVCAEPTWVLSAHDGSLKNFHGEANDIDLGTAMEGIDLATVDWLLGDKLSPATRKLIRDNLEHRLFRPYRAAVNGTAPLFWWMHGINNWNAVCLDGVTGSALAVIDSPAERAWYIAVAEKNIDYYLTGFTPDGYCVEGLGYWNYGFGNCTVLSEQIRRATGGHLDLLARPDIAQPALFGARAEIINGVYPTIADCHPGGQPAAGLMSFLNRRFHWQLPAWSETKLDGTLAENMALAFPSANLPVIPVANNLAEQPWRTCYPLGGVFTLRPGPDAATPFAVCVKGGNNGVSHGHNDVGSFSVVIGQTMVICDPGGEVYTKRTFSSHRYDSEVLNSFGHAVPKLAGQLQRSGSKAQAVLLATNYTAAADSLTFDLRSAYPVADLQKIERTFTYTRGDKSGLTVSDRVEYAAPETFESALVTWGAARPAGPNEWEFRDGEGAVRVTVDTRGQPFHVATQAIHEETEDHRVPYRFGITLDHPVSAATVTLHITPVTGTP